MLMNWFTESLKWQYLCLQFQPISLIKAIESVLCGLAWAVFTPNRIGEYGGRVLFLMPRKRIFGIIGMTVGAIRSEEHTSELQSLMRISYAVFCLKKQKNQSRANESNIKALTIYKYTAKT